MPRPTKLRRLDETFTFATSPSDFGLTVSASRRLFVYVFSQRDNAFFCLNVDRARGSALRKAVEALRDNTFSPCVGSFPTSQFCATAPLNPFWPCVVFCVILVLCSLLRNFGPLEQDCQTIKGAHSLQHFFLRKCRFDQQTSRRRYAAGSQPAKDVSKECKGLFALSFSPDAFATLFCLLLIVPEPLYFSV